VDLNIALENIIRLFNDITVVPVAIGLVLVITQLIKVAFGVKESTTATLIALGVQAVVWIAYSVLKARGMEVEFGQWVKAAEVIITTLVSVLFPAVLATAGAHYAYGKLHAANVPGFQTGTQDNKTVKRQTLSDSIS
jgi:hypothetical protein